MTAIDHTIATPHANIRVRESEGRGMPLLMIHAAGASKEAFTRQFDAPLSQIFRLIAIDLPGHGESADAYEPEAIYSYSGFGKVLRTVMDELAIEKAAAFGWSLGGHVALELLATDPRIAGLMITGAPPTNRGPIGFMNGFQMHRDMLLGSKEHLTLEDTGRLLRLYYRESEIPLAFAADLRRADGRSRPAVFRSMMRGHASNHKKAIETSPVPVAVVNGAAEPLARLPYVNNLAYRNLWTGRPHVIAGAGHAPFWEKPDVFNALLMRFLADVTEFARVKVAKIA